MRCPQIPTTVNYMNLFYFIKLDCLKNIVIAMKSGLIQRMRQNSQRSRRENQSGGNHRYFEREEGSVAADAKEAKKGVLAMSKSQILLSTIMRQTLYQTLGKQKQNETQR
jgi:hypothetical protein